MLISNLAYVVGLLLSVAAKSIKILIVSGLVAESPSLFTKEKASLNSSTGEFCEKSTLGEARCIWFPESTTKLSTPPEPPPSKLKSESFPLIRIVLFKNLALSYLARRSTL